MEMAVGFDGKQHSVSIGRFGVEKLLTLIAFFLIYCVVLLIADPSVVSRLLSSLPFPEFHDYLVLVVLSLPLLVVAWLARRLGTLEWGFLHWAMFCAAVGAVEFLISRIVPGAFAFF
jgi:hypothetical protein